MKSALRLTLLVALIALALSACGASAGDRQQAKGRPLPKFAQASLSAGRYHTTEFEPSLSFRITGDGWRFEGPSGTLGDPEHPDYLFFQKLGVDLEICFFNVRKLMGVYKLGGPKEDIEPVPAPDELVGWFQHHPYLKTSEPEPATVGGVKGVQFDVDVVNLQKGDHCLNIFALSTGGPSETCGFGNQPERYIVLEDVKGVPVVVRYGGETIDKVVPVAEKVLKSVQWTDT